MRCIPEMIRSWFVVPASGQVSMPDRDAIRDGIEYRTLPVCLMMVMLLFLPGIVRAEDKPAEKPPEPPSVVLCNPLSMKLGRTMKMTVRGLRLDQSTEVRCGLEGATVKILKKGTASVPRNFEAARVGDTEMVIEVTVPKTVTATETNIAVVSPGGESKPFRILISDPAAIVQDKEANDGFGQSQVVDPPCLIEGSIHTGLNVDVFAISAKAGQAVNARVTAHTLGSALDSILTLFDEHGRIIKTADDSDTPDAVLDIVVPRSGRYLLVLQDAHDQGGSTHPYRLEITAK